MVLCTVHNGELKNDLIEGRGVDKCLNDAIDDQNMHANR